MASTGSAQLGPERQLDLALTVALSFQQATQHADEKANMFLAVHAGLVAALIALYQGAAALPAGGRATATIVLAVVFALAQAGSAVCLAQTVRPRTGGSGIRDRFAFSAVATRKGDSGVDQVPTTELITEAWALAAVLARIAVIKYRYAARALGFLSVAIMAAAGLVVLALA
jgi:hypothetical protein